MVTMNTSVNIGASQDFRLSRALLVYGTSSYDGFPYRHPFVTLHEVIHDDEGARLGEGQLATPQMLIDLMVSLGKSLPVEILPERVLVRTTETVVWWAPAEERIMFFSDRGGDAALQPLNGKKYPHPSLLFKACGTHLQIRALAENKRPGADTKLYVAPYWNCYDDGAVCTGTMRIPREKSVTAIEAWERSFFQSEFTHAVGACKRTAFPGGLLGMWISLQGKKRFPCKYLVEAKQTLAEFVSNHDNKRPNRQAAD
jgi:PRTRC genetic system protein B